MVIAVMVNCNLSMKFWQQSMMGGSKKIKFDFSQLFWEQNLTME